MSPPGPQDRPPGSSPRSRGPLILTGVLVGLLIVVLGSLGAVFLLRGDGSGSATEVEPAADSSPSDSASSNRKAARTRPRTTPSQSAGGAGDVTSLPAGLFCRDLQARSYSYVAAVEYWRVHGNPNQMDADRNGIPCETVYSPSDVSAYWSVRSLPGAASVPTGQPPGLFCRDLYARGVSYSDAVAYWWDEGAPDRMDADRDGIPCATVYPATDINSYW